MDLIANPVLCYRSFLRLDTQPHGYSVSITKKSKFIATRYSGRSAADPALDANNAEACKSCLANGGCVVDGTLSLFSEPCSSA